MVLTFVMNALMMLKNIITDTGFQKLVNLNLTKFQKGFASSNKNIQKNVKHCQKLMW